MGKIVVGLLDSPNAADRVVDDQAESGFDRDAISLARDEDGVTTTKTARDRKIAGGVFGSLTGFGIPENDAHFYAEEVRRGSILVSVLCDDARAPIASEILDRHGAVDMNRRLAERQQVRESVRRTDIDIQGSGPQGRDEGFLAPDDEDFRQHFQSYYSRRGEDYRGFEEAYHYGATMSQYTRKDWQEVEDDIHRDWDKDHPGTWDRFREAIHYGWERTHRH